LNEKLIVNKLNEVYFKIDATDEQKYELRDYFSYYAKDYKYQPKFKYGAWNGKIYFYDMNEQTLPIGLSNELVAFAKRFNYDLQLNINKSDMYNNVEDSEFEEMYKHIFNDKFIVRDYQDNAVRKCIRSKRGIIESITASGKSCMIYSCIRYILSNYPDKKVLLIVPNISLVNQMLADFKDYGFEDADEYISILYSDTKKKCDFRKPVLISTWQSIYKKAEFFFKDYIGVICDEVHLAKSLSIQTIMKKCKHAEFRLGFSGTLPTEPAELMTIRGYIGQTLYKVHYKELIDRGILSKLKIANLVLKYPNDVIMKNKKRPYNEEVDTIIEYEPRNEVFRYILDNVKESDNVLILVNRIEHLKTVKTYIENYVKRTNRNCEVHEFYGKVKAEKREELRKNMNDNAGIIMVATYDTMSTGINIKRIHHVIFASSYKSKIKILQSLGRGLRVHAEKALLVLWDIVDDMTWKRKKRTGEIVTEKNHVYKHYEERLNYYNENGFSHITRKLDIEKI